MDSCLTLRYAGRYALRRNPVVRRWCADMMGRERADPAVHRARQEFLLGRIFSAARRFPAYTRYAERAPDGNRLAYLREAFPIIDKATLLQRPSEFHPRGRLRWPWNTVAATSGTTGTPLDVFRSFGSLFWEEAFHLQHWHWAGLKTGEHQAVLRGDAVVPILRRHPPYWFKDALGGQLVLSTRHLNRQTAVLFAEALQPFGATQLRAYPSAAHDLAVFIEETGLPVRFAAVITGSEMLYDFQRARIESVFKARVFDFYSMAERVAYAAECEYGRMHVNPEYGVLEIVDEHGQATDGEGTIVGTSLHNSLMPLIRYRMNDTARWSAEPCSCGRTYPVIERIGGRLADQLYDLDSRAVNCTVIGFAFDGMRNIQKAQVAQIDADQWVVRIVPGPQYTPADEQRVLARLTSHVSPRVRARVELVEQIPALPSGKYKWISQEWRRNVSSAVTSRVALPSPGNTLEAAY